MLYYYNYNIKTLSLVLKILMQYRNFKKKEICFIPISKYKCNPFNIPISINFCRLTDTHWWWKRDW